MDAFTVSRWVKGCKILAWQGTLTVSWWRTLSLSVLILQGRHAGTCRECFLHPARPSPSLLELLASVTGDGS